MITFNKKNNEYINISLLLLCIIFIIIYSLLTNNYRFLIAEILTNDILLLITVIIITLLAYFNIIAGFIISIIYIIMILPYFMKLRDNKEGFKINSKNKNKSKDIELVKAIKGNGSRFEKLMGKIEDHKKHKKREETYKNLNISSKYNTHSDNFNDILKETDKDILKKNEKEEFNDKETIKLRRFNPNDEFDNNLLMTKEICDDIKKRITYQYESTSYLKKYISSRLQEIIDLLDLSA
jgi:hypothetical protein